MSELKLRHLVCSTLAIGLLSGCASDGASRDRQQLRQSASAPKNVILFVGDGMGIGTVTAIRILEGQMRGETGEENVLSWETFPNVALSKTYNTNQQVPDSAGTATAFMTGVKTKAGVLGVGPGIIEGNCASMVGQKLKTALEIAAENGQSTGVVTTTRITHATPASTYAHIPHRNWEADSKMPAEALAQGCHDIARQLLEFSYGNGIEVALGGGRGDFMPKTAADPEYPAKHGLRLDGRNLIAEWQAKYKNAAYVWNKAAFAKIDPAKTDHLLGLFEPSDMQYEIDRAGDKAGEPSLAEMTAKAIQILNKNKKGYFLMVEGGRIDHGHHEGKATLALHDGVALAKAVKAADDMTDDKDTLIIVTADHSHTFVIAGYPTRGNPILGKAIGNDSSGNPEKTPTLAGDGKPYTTLGYYFSPSAAIKGTRPDLSNVDTEARDFEQQGTLIGAGHHSGEDVAIYAKGPGAEKVHGVMEQNLIFNVMTGRAPR